MIHAGKVIALVLAVISLSQAWVSSFRMAVILIAMSRFDLAARILTPESLWS